eukprot:7693068-Alexandrium_andersonii.AAC.1
MDVLELEADSRCCTVSVDKLGGGSGVQEALLLSPAALGMADLLTSRVWERSTVKYDVASIPP